MNEDGASERRVPEALHIPVGEVVSAWRAFRGLSLTELAERSQLSKGYISQVEHNKIKRPGDSQLAKLASGLGIEVWDLMARRMPNQDDGVDEKDRADPPIDSDEMPKAKPGKPVRFGSGYPIVPERSRNDMLREIMQRMEEIKLLLEEYLRADEDGSDE